MHSESIMLQLKLNYFFPPFLYSLIYTTGTIAHNTAQTKARMERPVNSPILLYVVQPVHPQNTARTVKMTQAVMRFFLLIYYSL